MNTSQDIDSYRKLVADASGGSLTLPPQVIELPVSPGVIVKKAPAHKHRSRLESNHVRVTLADGSIRCVAGLHILARAVVNGSSSVECQVIEIPNHLKSILTNVSRGPWNEPALRISGHITELMKLGASVTDLRFLLGRDAKTIKRYLKISSWPEEARCLLSGPPTLPSRALLALASRRMATEELVSKLVALREEQSSPARNGNNSIDLIVRLERFCGENAVSTEEHKLIIKALKHLGIL